MTAIRLQRYLSQAGVASRRKAEELIVRGAVTVNGKVVTVLGTKVEPGSDRVCVEGQAVYPQELFYILFNKPKGCITAVSDPEGRLTVMDYLQNVPVQVAPVGRLDYYTEGVLLLTNDGELSARLQSPGHHVEKTYHVKVRSHVSDRHIEVLRQGVRLDDGTVTRPAQVDRLRTKSRHDWLVITLTEGKTRQIHRMLEGLGYTVLKLQRVAFAGITYHGLRVGDARELTQVEVNHLREVAGLPKSTVSRGKWSAKREDSELSRRARARKLAKAEESAREPSRQPPAGKPRTSGKGRPGKPASKRTRSGKPARGSKPASRGSKPAARGSKPGKPTSRGGKPGKPRGSKPTSSRGKPPRAGRSQPRKRR